MKVGNEYIAAVLDFKGGFLLQQGKYENFRMITKEPEHNALMLIIQKKLKKHGVDMHSYPVDNAIAYQVSDRTSIKNLKSFMRSYCLVRRV